LPIIKLKLPGNTRWNGEFIILKQCFQFKLAILATLEIIPPKKEDENTKTIQNITNKAWTYMGNLEKILRPLNRVSLEWESDAASISEVIPCLKHLSKKLCILI